MLFVTKYTIAPIFLLTIALFLRIHSFSQLSEVGFLLNLSQIPLTFILLKYLKQNFIVCSSSASLLAISPWHIYLSESNHMNVYLFELLLIASFILPKYSKKAPGLLGLSLAGSVLAIVISLLFPSDQVKTNVEIQRRFTATQKFSYSQIFANKWIESFREKEKVFFEQIDFGNLFFSGHPRERGGVKEIPKLYIFMLPLALIGFSKLNKTMSLLLILWTLWGLTIPTIALDRSGAGNALLLFPIVVLCGLAANYLTPLRKLLPR